MGLPGPGGITVPVDDLEFASGTGTECGADRHRKSADDLAVFENRQLSVGNADQNLAGSAGGRTLLASPGDALSHGGATEDHNQPE
jgi:hypothetical protein